MLDESGRDLVDRTAVVDVCVQYATALDTRDWSLLAGCSTPDVVADYAGFGELRGYRAIEQLCQQVLNPLAASQHLLGNHAVAVTGDEARSTCYFQAQHVRPGAPGGDNYVVAGTYRDHLVRTDDGWRIDRRALEVTWVDGNPAVAAVDALPARPVLTPNQI